MLVSLTWDGDKEEKKRAFLFKLKGRRRQFLDTQVFLGATLIFLCLLSCVDIILNEVFLLLGEDANGSQATKNQISVTKKRVKATVAAEPKNMGADYLNGKVRISSLHGRLVLRSCCSFVGYYLLIVTSRC